TSQHYQFNNQDNPWQPLTGTTRSGYIMRAITLKHIPIYWPSVSTTHAAPPVDNDVAQQNPWAPMVKISSFKNAAIVADIFSPPARVDARHKKGINVLFANGGAKYVLRDQLHNLPATVKYRYT